jgi:formylglycine-generating enzyme required for sulfatase activity
LPWQHTAAEQRLRMEIALLQLWREPEKATEELYRLYQLPGNLPEEISERLAQLGDGSQYGKDVADASTAKEEIPSNSPLLKEVAQRAGGFSASHKQQRIYLPWHLSTLPARTRLMLAKMGFGGYGEQKHVTFQMPVKLSLALGACSGLVLVALGTAILRLLAPTTPVFRPVLPEPFQTVIIQDAQRSGVNDYRIAIGAPKALRTETATAQSVIDIDWQWPSQYQAQPQSQSAPPRPQPQPNVKQVGQSQLWHAGTLPQAIRGCEEGPNKEQWPRRSLVVIQADPTDFPARQLATRLLDRGSADLVLLGTDGLAHLNELVQIDAKMTKSDQLVLILPSGATVPQVDFQGAVGVVTSFDLKDLLTRLNFSGVRPLTEVWDKVQVTGTPLLRGGPEEQRDDKSGMTFVTVCGGTFTMGSDKEKVQKEDLDETPPHPVTLSTFEISKTEVTNAQYRQLHKDHKGEDSLPATSISWNEAKAFCEHYGYSLPTEAQWEYAARGGSTTRWSFGDDEKELGNYAWFSGNSGNKTHPVGTKAPNPLGLSDMHGNVWEWVEDCFDDKAYQERSTLTVNPLVSPSTSCSSGRVLRGGSWVSGPWDLRSAYRRWSNPEGQDDFIGVRCVRAPRR